MRFGKLIVIKILNTTKLLCLCDCGKITESWRGNITQGKKTTCGCSRQEGKDITGKTFGRWTAIKPQKLGEVNFWECRCVCGITSILERSGLVNGHSRSCGCLQREIARENGENNIIDIHGKRYGRLIVIKRESSKWLCKCDCGLFKKIASSSLIHGITKSCGCLAKEIARRIRFNPSITNKEREKQRTIDIEAYKNWRTSVFKRDNWTCVICYSKENICAHHKNGYNKYKEQRFVITNGETCCNRCHTFFHKIYGKGNNTEKQWLDFNFKIKNKELILPLYYPSLKYSVSIGEKYNLLTIINFIGVKNSKSLWECKCDCGNKKNTFGSSLKSGSTKSCGCLLKISASNNIKNRKFNVHKSS